MAKYIALKNKITGERSMYNSITKEKIYEKDNITLFNELRKKWLNNMRQSQKNDAMRSLGLKKTPYGWE